MIPPTLERYVASHRAESATFVGIIVSICLVLAKFLPEFIDSCSPSGFAGCSQALWAELTLMNVILFGVPIAGVTAMFWLHVRKLIESWRKAKHEPLGFFFAQVEPTNPKMN